METQAHQSQAAAADPHVAAWVESWAGGYLPVVALAAVAVGGGGGVVLHGRWSPATIWVLQEPQSPWTEVH